MLSYAETGRLVERLAYWFDSHHSRERIAVVGENSIQWVLSFYALVCSRNTVALPDPNLSAKDLSEILNRVHTTTVLLSPAYAHAEELKTLMPQAVFMPLTYDAVMQFAEQAEGENSDPSVHAPDDPAAIHFTSGTTGLPKCVLLTQDNLLACAQGTDSIYFYYETPRSMAMLP